ncbi:hypothetical protein JOF43_002056 [Brachybacterium sacelli]|uniref:WXG100 family type VII secretion target n=2 Tax=Brachybacterium sacelli TaxID=173364 RepID=A0ABS4X0V9_9MICO|nr:WXG100 family type VII secretion target [Brachybacterium sacelli]MBP2382099.1 hypothetical protein [Brachybacterium sacelli]
MSSWQGMDTEAVRAHGERLRTVSGDVDGLRDRLDASVQGAGWTGPDAEAFRMRWNDLAASTIASLCTQLLDVGAHGIAEADEQDAASAQDGGPAPRSGDRHDEDPWLPVWLEGHVGGAASDLAGRASDTIGWGFETGIDLLEGGLDTLGVNTEGIAQFQRDADHLGGVLEDWATGERVPTFAELGAAALLTAGSAGVGVYEAVSGEDTALLDDRPGGIVQGVQTVEGPSSSPQDLQDLIARNDGLRRDNPGQTPLEAGTIGIQEVRGAHGGDPAYIVQVPPTEGAAVTEVPEAYGGQGNSRDWGSNLRLVAGQHPAAMDDVRAALEAADVPAGADVLLVGHSQGGIVGNHLAADPSFNSSSGEPGTYNVTHAFSVGSPVQTVVPAQDSTQSVNVNHEAGIGTRGFSGDLIAATDLDGAQPGGTHLSAPNRHEVTLDPYPVTGVDPVPVLEANHDSMGPGHDPAGGYSGSVARATASDPTLSTLQNDLTGVYLGDGTYVSRSQVVTVGRGEP